MKERAIPFNAAMARATLEDRKTQTRRVLTQAVGPSLSVDYDEESHEAVLSWLTGNGPGHDVEEVIKRVRSPYGVPGDRLWGREAWRAPLAYELTPPRDIEPGTPILYESGGVTLPHFSAGKYRPAMFMPRWASRITVEVTGVRVERVQEISQVDAIAEGIERDGEGWKSYSGGSSVMFPSTSYSTLWDDLNDSRGFGWDTNPYVWVVEFRRIKE